MICLNDRARLRLLFSYHDMITAETKLLASIHLGPMLSHSFALCSALSHIFFIPLQPPGRIEFTNSPTRPATASSRIGFNSATANHCPQGRRHLSHSTSFPKPGKHACMQAAPPGNATILNINYYLLHGFPTWMASCLVWPVLSRPPDLPVRMQPCERGGCLWNFLLP